MKIGPIVFVVLILSALGVFVHGNLETGYSTEKDCYPFCDSDEIAEGLIKIVQINAISENRELYFDEPVDLIIKGVSGKIKILENSKVNSIAVRGTDMHLLLHKDLQPQIVNVGVGFDISYFE